MDIEDFYAQDERRRASAEYEFGSEWTDRNGNVYELSWVEATGELYLMLGPDATVTIEPVFGDVVSYNESTEDLQIKVIMTLTSIDAVEDLLVGWQDAMIVDGSISWLAERTKSRGSTGE